LVSTHFYIKLILGDDRTTLLGCFVPLIVFCCMAACKVVFFRSLSVAMWIAIIVSIVSESIVLHLMFDKGYEELPLFLMALPLAIFLMSFAIN